MNRRGAVSEVGPSDSFSLVARKKKDGFNSPFADLKAKVGATPAAAPKPAQKPTPPPEVILDEQGDSALFEQWVGETKPVRGKDRLTRSRPAPSIARALQDEEDAETLAQLSDLVAGRGDFDLADTEEWIDGLAPGIDRKLLRRLKRGDFSLQGHLDLHGMVKETAQREVQRFLKESRGQGKRCILLVHGRGLGSPGGRPVLKHALVRWLSRGELGRQVLCFCTAKPEDGGAGAVYVLLRR